MADRAEWAAAVASSNNKLKGATTVRRRCQWMGEAKVIAMFSIERV